MFVRNAITLTSPHVQSDRVNNKTIPQTCLPRHHLRHLPLLLRYDSHPFFSHHKNPIFPTWILWRSILKLMHLHEASLIYYIFSLYISIS